MGKFYITHTHIPMSDMVIYTSKQITSFFTINAACLEATISSLIITLGDSSVILLVL